MELFWSFIYTLVMKESSMNILWNICFCVRGWCIPLRCRLWSKITFHGRALPRRFSWTLLSPSPLCPQRCDWNRTRTVACSMGVMGILCPRCRCRQIRWRHYLLLCGKCVWGLLALVEGAPSWHRSQAQGREARMRKIPPHWEDQEQRERSLLGASRSLWGCSPQPPPYFVMGVIQSLGEIWWKNTREREPMFVAPQLCHSSWT